ncbi:hypothetical protein [Aliidiomarina iranensis]|uniref:hypothetical protein n=1 Tax=Aliidiomarina iranensis TaxID=1434071 RepID=UPI000F89B8D7|nr:hypothetical protein [Aliidiomarina iranensis]
MKNQFVRRAIFAVSVIVLTSALPWHGIYFFPIRYPSSIFEQGLFSFSISALQLAFIVVPLMAVITAWFENKTAFLWAGIYPVIATAFGVFAVPLLGGLASISGGRFWILLSVNITVMVIVLLLYVKSRTAQITPSAGR